MHGARRQNVERERGQPRNELRAGQQRQRRAAHRAAHDARRARAVHDARRARAVRRAGRHRAKPAQHVRRDAHDDGTKPCRADAPRMASSAHAAPQLLPLLPPLLPLGPLLLPAAE